MSTYFKKVWEKKLEQHKKDMRFAIDYLLKITSRANLEETIKKNREFIIKYYEK